VFCGEQGVPLDEELDGLDRAALHLVAVEDDHVIGTCRLLREDDATTRLGRMAVDPAHRGRGVAQRLLRAAEQEARAAGSNRITLSAQLAARRVYGRSGYAEHGGVFLDAGIEHVEMDRDLA
jgi:predicted GNAT family N-acyltransferase